MSMTWTRVDTYHQRADTGYTVCADRVGQRLIYCAWTPGSKGTPECLGLFETAAEARARCEEDLKGPGGAANTDPAITTSTEKECKS